MSVNKSVLSVLFALAVTSAFATLKWDNNTGNYKVYDSGNWYVSGTDPKERPVITSTDSVESDGAYHVLDGDYAFEVEEALFGRWSSNPSTLDISNGTFKVANHLILGHYGQNTALNIYSGRLETKQLTVGNWGSHDNNTMTVYGGEVVATGGNWPSAITMGLQTESRGDLVIKGGSVTACNNVNIGFSNLQNQGGPSADFNSSLTVEGGLFSVTGTVYVANADGDNYGGGGHFVQTGGETYISGNLEIGQSSNSWARVDVTGGKLTVKGTTHVGNKEYGQPAVLSIANADVTMGELSPGRYCDGTVYLTDSTLTVGTFAKAQGAAGTARFYADNATVVFTSSYAYTLSSLATIEIGEGGIVFDTNTHSPTIQAFPAMTGVGGITKKGSGTLKIDPNSFGFAGDYKAHGKIVVEAGTLRMPTGQTFYCTGTNVAAGATLNLNGSTLVIIDEKNRVSKSVWTDAMGDHDATNPYNWTSTVEFFKNGEVLSDLTDTLYVCPTSETSVRVPYGATISNFDPTTYASVDYVIDSDKDVSFITDLGKSYDDYTASLTVSDANVKIANSFNALLKSAVAWYDPSDASTLTISDDGIVTKVANKGYKGEDMDAKKYAGNDQPLNAAMVSTEELRQNGLNILVFTNNHGYVSSGKLDIADGQPRALFAVSSREKLGAFADSTSNSDSFPLEISDDTMWSGNTTGRVAIHQLDYNQWSDELCAHVLKDDGNVDYSYSLGGLGEANGEGHMVVWSLNAKATSAKTSSRYWSASNQQFIYNSNAKTYQKLYGAEGMNVRYGRRNQWNTGSKGRIGESLAFVSDLSDEAAAAINNYLAAKWLGDTSGAVTTNATTIASLTLEGADVDCDGAPVSVGTLSGAGTLSNHAGVTVTGALKITFDAEGNPNAITCNGAFAMDANATVEASEEVFKAVRAYLLSAKQPVTVVTATSVTLPKKLLVKDASGRTFQLVKKGNMLVFEIQPSFTIHVR